MARYRDQSGVGPAQQKNLWRLYKIEQRARLTMSTLHGGTVRKSGIGQKVERTLWTVSTVSPSFSSGRCFASWNAWRSRGGRSARQWAARPRLGTLSAPRQNQIHSSPTSALLARSAIG